MHVSNKAPFNFLSSIPAHEKKITLSTKLTLLRIIMTPVIVAAMLWQWWGAAFILFLMASVTDVLDGMLARRRNERTFLGAALDPVADKFLLVSCFFALAFVQSPLFSIPRWFVGIVVLKELMIVLGALVLYRVKGSIDIKPTIFGKGATVIQVCFITWLFACYFFGWIPIKTYYTMLAIVLVALGVSLIQYLYVGYCQCVRS